MPGSTTPLDYLLFHASYRGDDIALQGLAFRLSYAQLLPMVRAAAARLRAQGIGPGTTVVTMIADKHIDFIVTLAAMHEGAATMSCVDLSDYPPGIAPTLVVTDRAIGCAAPCLHIDGAWLSDTTLGGDPTPPRGFDADAPFRIAFTSGTTGHSKIIVQTLPRIVGAATDPAIGQQAMRNVAMMGFGSLLGFRDALATLLQGSPLYHAATVADVVALAAQQEVQFISGSTFHLLALAQVLQHTTLRLPALRQIRVSGTLPNAQQLALLQSTLCPSVECRYGMSETGPTHRYQMQDRQVGEGCVGLPVPGVETQIVDDAHRPLPPGREGRVRVRTQYMVNGYLGAPQRTAEAFIDGWFYPGDLGVIDARGMLLLRGRVSEVIHRDGHRIDPARIDAVALGHPQVIDAAAFGFVKHDGLDAICLAVVGRPELDPPALLRHISDALGMVLAPSHLIVVAAIPRNDMGKALRGELQRLYADTVRGHAAH